MIYSQEEIIKKLSHYNYTDELEGDVIPISIDSHDSIDFIIKQVKIMIGMRLAPWKEGSLLSYKEYIVNSKCLTWIPQIIKCGYKHAIVGEIERAVSFSDRQNKHPKGANDIRIYIKVGDYVPEVQEDDLQIMILCHNPLNVQIERIRYFNNYPRLPRLNQSQLTEVKPPGGISSSSSLHENKVNLDNLHIRVTHQSEEKLIHSIEVLSCSSAYARENQVKANTCRHSVIVNFEDGTFVMDFTDQFTVKDFEIFGYIPYCKLKLPKESEQAKLQSENCELYNRLQSNQFYFGW